MSVGVGVRSSGVIPKANVWLAVFVVLLVGCVGVLASCSSGDDVSVDGAGDTMGGVSETGLVFGPVTVDGEPLPAFDLQAPVDPAVGLAFPNVSGVNFDGAPVTIAADGRPKVIVFLTHHSAIAEGFATEASSWAESGSVPDGVDVYAVSTKASPDKSNFPPAGWLESLGWPFMNSTLVDSETSEAFAVSGGPGLPLFVIVDGDGRVVGRAIGNLSAAGFSQLVVAAETGVFDASVLERTALG